MEMGGFRIATIRGIPIRIHITFLLVLPLLAFGFGRAFKEAIRLAELPPEHVTGNPFVWGLGVALALFLSVLLHELGHSLYALKKGGTVRDITLLMIGGVSQMSEMPRQPKHEAIMALIGPLVSIGLGVLLYLLHMLAGASAMSFPLRFGLFYLAGLNLFLGVFNLLPAFPMDGGRIMRALLSPRLGVLRATRVSTTTGKVFAVLFGIWGFLSLNMLLLLIAFFVFIGAESEMRAVLVKALVGKLRVGDLMSTEVSAIPDDVSVFDAADRMLREQRMTLGVLIDGRALGSISLEDVQRVAPERRMTTTVGQIAARTPHVRPDDDVSKALQIMGETDARLLAVADDGNWVGTIGRDDIVRSLKLGELEATQHGGQRWPLRGGGGGRGREMSA